MPQRLLELFSGTGSMGRAFEELGWEVTSLDVDPKLGAAAQVCSRLFRHDLGRVLMRRPRRLEEGDRLVLRTLHLIQQLQPRFWAIENPATWRDVSYCTYGYPYRKLTRVWGNLDWMPEQPVCGIGGYRCERSRRFGRHPEVAQRGTVRRSGKIVQNCRSQAQLYSIPPALCREIAATVNARIVTSP